MSLEPLEKEKILDFMRKSYDVEIRYLLITLIDGNHLIGRRGYHGDLNKINYVILSLFKGSMSIDISVPFNRIAGISIWNVEQKIEFKKSEDVDEEDLNQKSLDSILSTELLEKAKHYEFQTDISHLQLSIPTEEIVPGAIKFSDFTCLHCNYELIESDWLGTVKTVRPSIFGIGVNIDVEKKFRLVKKRVSQKISSLSGLKGNSNKKIVVKGFIQILTHSDGSDQTVTMDGKEWLYMALSEIEVNKSSELYDTPWCLCAFSKDKWSYPLESIDALEVPVNVYGEFLEMINEIGTEKKEGLLKASVAAFIPE